MSNTNEWNWQGFYGPRATAIAAKVIIDKDTRAGAWVPVQGQPPLRVDTTDTHAMFAVQTRPSNPIPTPEGMLEADPGMVGRMVGA